MGEGIGENNGRSFQKAGCAPRVPSAWPVYDDAQLAGKLSGTQGIRDDSAATCSIPGTRSPRGCTDAANVIAHVSGMKISAPTPGRKARTEAVFPTAWHLR